MKKYVWTIVELDKVELMQEQGFEVFQCVVMQEKGAFKSVVKFIMRKE